MQIVQIKEHEKNNISNQENDIFNEKLFLM